MRILFVNDDGINSIGINVLAETFCEDNDVYMVAPNSERSACSHSLTIMNGLSYKSEKKHPKIKAFSTSGTPADCVKFAALHLLKDETPDIVISGINNGANVGSDIMYSGTVSAACEAAYLGIPSIAISLAKHNCKQIEFQKAADFLYKNFSALTALDLSPTTILNINYPVDAPYKGAKVTKAGILYYFDHFVEVENSGSYELRGHPKPEIHNDEDCDVEWIKKGYATVSPLHLDRNNYEALKLIKNKVKFK